MTEPDAQPPLLGRFVDAYVATATATAAVTAATVFTAAALPAAVLASWRKALPPRRRRPAQAAG